MALFASYALARFTFFLRRNAMLTRYRCLRLVFVCVSSTLRYCIKTAKHRITQGVLPGDFTWRAARWSNLCQAASCGPSADMPVEPTCQENVIKLSCELILKDRILVQSFKMSSQLH